MTDTRIFVRGFACSRGGLEETALCYTINLFGRPADSKAAQQDEIVVIVFGSKDDSR
jgi:hypothetical protein